MQALAAIYKSTGEFAAAVKRLKHAIEVNPLDQALRTELGNVHRLHGAALTVEGNLVEARAAFRSAVELLIGRQRFLTLCHWAACEFKAGADAASEQLLARISADEANRPAMAACLFALAVALKFPKPAKARFEREFRQQLAAKPTIPTVSALVGLYAQFELDDFTYHGGKTHQKRVLTLAERLIDEPFTEAEMDSLGGALLALRARRSLKRLAQWWRVIFRVDPYPLFFELECDLISDDCRWPIWRLKPFAERALRLAEKMPQGERRDYVLKRIKARLQQFHDLDPFSSMFESIFDSGSSGDSDWEDNDSW
jgi:tetratricopeptide (TPR) repeat protein